MCSFEGSADRGSREERHSKERALADHPPVYEDVGGRIQVQVSQRRSTWFEEFPQLCPLDLLSCHPIFPGGPERCPARHNLSAAPGSGAGSLLVGIDTEGTGVVDDLDGSDAGASRPALRAGGRAGEGGMDFQAAVGTWLAVHLLCRIPVGTRFAISPTPTIEALRLETGDALDDIEASQSDDGAIHLQAKTGAGISDRANSPLGKTIAQLAQLVANAKSSGIDLDPVRTAAVLAVKDRAPRTLDQLQEACRAFALGGDWPTTKAQRNQKQQEALAAFESVARAAWPAKTAGPIGDDDLVAMARLFRIERFSMEEGGHDWREASRLLGRHLYGSDHAGEAPLRDLKGIVRELIGSGAPADRNGLLRALRAKGHVDVGAPRFDDDVQRLRAHTADELARLKSFTQLPLGGGVTLARTSDAPLTVAMRAGSLLVTGDPGAGKTGALVNAANLLQQEPDTELLFLAVDRFPGVAIAADLQSELRLSHALVEVLENFPGGGPKILLIDALDAARGGPSEAVFAALVEQARKFEGWTVIASMRTFDLRNGRRFRQAFAGTPADAGFADPLLGNVRHFTVPALSAEDLATAGSAAPRLGDLLAAAPSSLAGLLSNVFNLSLAAQLLADGLDPAAIRALRTQSDLLDAYENARLTSTNLERAAGAAAERMVELQRLMVRKVAIHSEHVDPVIQSGILVERGPDSVSFGHHVLFDHVTGRFFLELDDANLLVRQISGDVSRALFLAPALRFAIERAWRLDDSARSASWNLIQLIFTSKDVDTVVANVALRSAAENIREPQDLEGLLALIRGDPACPGLTTLLQRLSRFASISEAASDAIDPSRAIAWATLAEACAAANRRQLAEPARFLVQLVIDKADLTDGRLFALVGSASRQLLRFAWDQDPPATWLASIAIRFVGRTFGSDRAASRDLLSRILEEPHFSSYAEQEAPWLAEHIVEIAGHDPDFAEEIYRELYGKTISDEASTFLGGRPSRILALTSNRRQDYGLSHHHLGRGISQFLAISARHGTRAVIGAALGTALTSGYSQGEPTTIALPSGKTLELRGRMLELNAWDERDRDLPGSDDDILAQFVQFLRVCSPGQFDESLSAASDNYATGAVWARLFGVGSERPGELADLLWPLATSLGFLEHEDTLRDAIRCAAACYPSRSPDERRLFEERILAAWQSDDEHEKRWRRRLLGRLLNLVAEADLATDAMRTLRTELAAGDEFEDNDALHSFRVSHRAYDHVREMLHRQGVDADSPPIAALLETSDALHQLVNDTPAESGAGRLAALWASTAEMVVRLDAADADVPDEVLHQGWGYVANAVQRIASAPAFAPGTEGLPTLAEIVGLLDRLSDSAYPKVKEG